MSADLSFAPRVLVLGLGLLGGSFARSLRDRGLAGCLRGRDADPVHGREALARGLVDGLWAPEEAPEPFDLVFVAVPPGQVRAALAGLGPWLRADTVVMDACSVKGGVARDLAAALGPHPGLLPAHPIAGGHASGPAAAQGDLFVGAAVVLTPLPCTASATLARGRALWEALGARVATMDPAEHDRQLALLSHLPHLVAYALVNLAEDGGADLALAGPGFRDATRLAQCPAPLWADIALANRTALGEALRDLADRLEALAAGLAQADRAGLTETFDRARVARTRLAGAGPLGPRR